MEKAKPFFNIAEIRETMQGAWFLYIDESGDLGFDPCRNGRSRFFTICLLAIRTNARHKSIIQAVKKTLKRKLNNKKKRNRSIQELKGSQTSLEIKKYFFKQITGVHFGIYSLTLPKDKLYPGLQNAKDRTYNYLARLLLEQLPFEAADTSVDLYIDKSKSHPEIVDFNSYIKRELKSRLSTIIPLRINHGNSCEHPGLQAADLFCHGVFRKYERGDQEWFNVFKGKVRYDQIMFSDAAKK